MQHDCGLLRLLHVTAAVFCLTHISWVLPLVLAFVYIRFFLAWAPHHPGKRQGRYRDTRAFKSRLGNLLSLGMQYHIVHHLYPHIPLSKTPAAYRELKPILQQRGCDLGDL